MTGACDARFDAVLGTARGAEPGPPPEDINEHIAVCFERPPTLAQRQALAAALAKDTLHIHAGGLDELGVILNFSAEATQVRHYLQGALSLQLSGHLAEVGRGERHIQAFREHAAELMHTALIPAYAAICQTAPQPERHLAAAIDLRAEPEPVTDWKAFWQRVLEPPINTSLLAVKNASNLVAGGADEPVDYGGRLVFRSGVNTKALRDRLRAALGHPAPDPLLAAARDLASRYAATRRQATRA